MCDGSGRANTLARKVLCIDDNPDILQIEKAILEAAGYEVLLAISGELGISTAKDCGVDLVVVDSDMPLMSGTQVAQSLRDMRPKLPIIMVSGGCLPDEAALIIDSFVPKTELVTTLVRQANRLTRRCKTCAFCNLPIQDEGMPSVSLKDGEEVHVECYSKMT